MDPCPRFADPLTEACAGLRADVTLDVFIVVDLRHLLLAGLPAYPTRFSTEPNNAVA